MKTAGDDLKVTEQAAQWLSALLDGNERRAEFFAWLEESPRHVEEFLSILADAQDLALLTQAQRQRIEEMSSELGGAGTVGANVVSLPHKTVLREEQAIALDSPATQVRTASAHSAMRRFGVGLAAALLLALGAMWWFTGAGAWQSYSTKLGEQRLVTLADGSVVHLNTDSTVAVRLGDGTRRVQLIRGEALFDVAHDPNRPFLVQSANAVIQAIGTSFDVYRRESGTRVAVIEGVVQVSEDSKASPVPRPRSPPSAPQTQLLAAGESAEVSSGGRISERQAVNAVKAVAWRQRRLVFEDDTLADIATEFNRYNAKVKIRVLGAAAVNEHFSGTFDADAPEAIMLALIGDPRLRVERVGDEIVIQERDRQ